MVTYKSILLKIDVLFSNIKKLSNINGKSKAQSEKLIKLQKAGYQRHAFDYIKEQVRTILDELAKLHAYVNNEHITGNLELIGKFMNDLMEAWDVFFYGIATMRIKGDRSWTKKQTEMYLRLAARETYQCRSRIKRVRERLRGKFADCEFRNEDTAKQMFEESRVHFQLQSLNFTGEDPIPEQQELILTDSSIDTSDDEDLLQEVDNFYRNLVNWYEGEQKRKEDREVRRVREIQQHAEDITPLPSKKARYDSEDEMPSGYSSGSSSISLRRRKREVLHETADKNDSESSDSDPSSDMDYNPEEDNPDYATSRLNIISYMSMQRRTYETRQRKREKELSGSKRPISKITQ